MKVPYKKILRICIAALLLIPGVLGIFLPVLSGTFFIVAALLILSLEIPSLELWLDKIGRKNSKVNHVYIKIKHFIQKHF